MKPARVPLLLRSDFAPRARSRRPAPPVCALAFLAFASAAIAGCGRSNGGGAARTDTVVGQGPACGERACGPDEYCALPAGACTANPQAAGACTARPEACIEVYDPVCGCDGKVYGNDCHAAREGQNVAHRGECGAGGADAS